MLVKKGTLRIPVLPLEGAENIDLTFYNQEIKHMGIVNEVAREKYYKRMKYRTTPLYAMVSENIVEFSSKDNIEVNKVSEFDRKILSNSLSDLCESDEVMANPFVYNSGNYLKLENNESIYYIKKTNIINEIFDRLNKKKIEISELIMHIHKNHNQEISTIICVITELIEKNFIILDVNSNRLRKIKIRKRRNDKPQTLKVNENDLKKIYKIAQKLSSINVLDGYEETINYFCEKYSNYLISLEIVLKDKQMIKLANEIKYIYKYNDAVFLYLIDIAQRNKYTNEINIDIDDLPNDPQNIGSVDIHINLLQKYYNLDNLRTIKNIGTINKNALDELTGLNIIDYSEGSAIFLPELRKQNINVNIFDKESLNLSDLYLGYDNIDKKLRVYDENKNIIKIRKLTNYDLKFYSEEIKSLLIMSGVNNLDRSIINYKIYDFLSYIPRIVIEDKFIIIRRTWIIKKLSSSANSKEWLNNYLKNESIDMNVALIKDDLEIIVNISNDFDFIYKEYTKNSILVLKEILTSQSSLLIDNKKYNNELIFSIVNESNKVQNNLINKNSFIDNTSWNIENVQDDNWIYFKVYLKNFLLESINFILMINERFSRFFFVNYKDMVDNDYLRLRFYREDISNIISFFKECKCIEEYILSTYNREIFRYRTIGINNFEKISMCDSKRIVNTFVNYGIDIFESKELKIEFLVCNTISLIEDFNIGVETTLNLLKRYKTGSCDRNFYRKIEKIIESTPIKFKNLEIQESLDISNAEEVLAIIHMSNNRAIGINIELERKIYKYIYLYVEKMYWRNKHE
ncbi:thiopeptide-type bacteriocin biosynthesis protein [Staphylococcus delphini]|uniref:thiopeptide-type bacteriocin biosynthesis protein n=1 Tax=Staphylococcus delphini TaxID=53344 RepID=UPI000BBBE807|nr:thiopeptide-type bacteriocin biosynthesis protein [Staphylococcus delphini]PCF42485.1 hypothetical protein B5C06_05925 [Staphylococcus delphini]